MLVSICKVKVENAVVTEANLHYHGSFTVDEVILEKAGILPYEKVLVVNFNNGARFDTYVIPGEKNSGVICLNGATARLGRVGDKVGFLVFGIMEESKARDFKPQIITLKEGNKVQE